MHENFYNKDLKQRARDLRNRMTKTEKFLWYGFLRSIQPRAHRQRALGNYIVDFYIPKASLVIEIDGDSHFVDSAEKYDGERSTFLTSLGLEVIRFTNTDIYVSFDAVCEVIRSKVESKTKSVSNDTPPNPLL